MKDWKRWKAPAHAAAAGGVPHPAPAPGGLLLLPWTLNGVQMHVAQWGNRGPQPFDPYRYCRCLKKRRQLRDACRSSPHNPINEDRVVEHNALVESARVAFPLAKAIVDAHIKRSRAEGIGGLRADANVLAQTLRNLRLHIRQVAVGGNAPVDNPEDVERED